MTESEKDGVPDFPVWGARNRGSREISFSVCRAACINLSIWREKARNVKSIDFPVWGARNRAITKIAQTGSRASFEAKAAAELKEYARKADSKGWKVCDGNLKCLVQSARHPAGCPDALHCGWPKAVELAAAHRPTPDSLRLLLVTCRPARHIWFVKGSLSGDPLKRPVPGDA
ncbi:unnamed protein product [Symbiodinium natans]|uniref:Uncharacterized protein n=1 Tax=Symbiodinium natans TaxID=878477 RepID=A0A812TYN4_9DINO|nr:unnamed protein product [Symbiodinium natans]